MYSFRALLAVLLVLATARAMPTSSNTIAGLDATVTPQPPVSHHDLVRNAMHDAVVHRVDKDCNATCAADNNLPSDEKVEAINACIGRPTLLRMKWCMRQAAESGVHDDGGDCVAPEQLEVVWRCVERHSVAGSGEIEKQQEHVDASMIPHRLYGKDKADVSSILILKDDGYTVGPGEPLVKRKYGYGPNWLTAAGVRRAHPLP